MRVIFVHCFVHPDRHADRANSYDDDGDKHLMLFWVQNRVIRVCEIIINATSKNLIFYILKKRKSNFGSSLGRAGIDH